MNEIQLYSAIMFFAGVALSRAVFYFDNKKKLKRFYLLLSASILQVLDNVYITHKAAIEFASEQLKNVEHLEKQEYLQMESEKLSVFMDLYVLLLVKSVPPEGRVYINYKSWSEAKSLIKELRGIVNNEQIKR